MGKACVGISLESNLTYDSLADELERACADGFDAVEMNLSAFPFIIAGELQPRVAEYVRSVVQRYPLKLTMHAGYGLDLRNLEEYAMHKNVLMASIDACTLLGADRLNLHFEEESMFTARERAFFQAHQEAADYAMERGVMLNIENIEVEYADKAADFVRRLDHKNVGMTLDLGHLYLSACYFGYDYLDTVRRCAPLVRHVHVNDNVGIFEPMRVENHRLYDTLSMGYRTMFGRGDIHIAPFWGKAPLEEGMRILKDAGFSGIWLCEYKSRSFLPFNREVQQRVRRIAEQ